MLCAQDTDQDRDAPAATIADSAPTATANARIVLMSVPSRPRFMPVMSDHALPTPGCTMACAQWRDGQGVMVVGCGRAPNLWRGASSYWEIGSHVSRTCAMLQRSKGAGALSALAHNTREDAMKR